MFNKNRVNPAISKNYNGNFDILKLVFSVIIFLFHFVDQWKPTNLKLFFSGAMAVEFYFIISGYFMALSVSRRKIDNTENLGKESINFVWKKAQAILPYYLFTYLVSLVCYCIYQLDSCETFLDYIHRFTKMIPNFLLLSSTGIEQSNPFGITWYISAMLIAMLLLYPLLVKYKDLFLRVVAPLVSVILLGYLSQTYGDLTASYKLIDGGFVTLVFLRGIMGICVGCCCFVASEKLKSINFTKLSKNLFALAEMLIYTFVVFALAFMKRDVIFPLIIVLFFAVTITASRQSSITHLFDNNFSKWLGKLSLAIYLNQGATRRILIYSDWDLTLKQIFVLYVLYTTISTVACMIITSSISKYYAKNKLKIKSKFIK